jgi:hypothetical protein
MASYTNASGGKLILPDGTEIEAGESAEVSDTKNVGVSQWIDDGWLVGGVAAQKPAEAPAEQKPAAVAEEPKKG